MSIYDMGGEVIKNKITIPCVPSTALKATLDSMRLAGTPVEGMFVKFTFANNYEVAQAGDGEPRDGVLEQAIPDNWDGYHLSVRAYNFSDKDGNRHALNAVGEYSYTGSPSLQDYVVVDTSAAMTVKPGSSYGDGSVYAIDTTNSIVKVLLD